MATNDAIKTYLEGLYIPDPFAAADLATLIQHYIAESAEATATDAFLALIAAAEA